MQKHYPQRANNRKYHGFICKMAGVVFTQPAGNAFMARPMKALLKHAKKEPPPPGNPGIFALGGLGIMEKAVTGAGFVDYEQHVLNVPLRMKSTAQAFQMMQEAFGAYRGVIHDSPEDVRKAAWAEVEDILNSFENESGFEAPAEVLVFSARKPT